MIACFNLILKLILLTICFLIVHCQGKLISGMLETYNLRWVTLNFFRSLIHLRSAESFGWSRKSTYAHASKTVYSCREVELPRADPVKYIASWLMSFVSHVLLLSTLIMLLTVDQSYLLYMWILDSLNIWVTVLNKMYYVDLHMYHFYFPVLTVYFYSFSSFLQFFQWRKNIHLRVSWFLQPLFGYIWSPKFIR